MSEGNWLVLSSANHFLDSVKEVCELTWLVLSISKDVTLYHLKLLLALNNWESWRKGVLIKSPGDKKYL